MPETKTDQSLRLLALALIGVGLVGLLDAATGPLLVRGLQIGWSVLLIPAGAALLTGRVGWVRPLLRVMQWVVVLSAAVLVGAAFAPDVPFLAEGVEVSGSGRAVMGVVAVVEAGIWVWVLGLGRRWAALRLEGAV